MARFAIIENAKRQLDTIFYGIAIPHQPSLAEGVYGPIKSEKVLKFNRSSLRGVHKSKSKKSNPRYKGGNDLMRNPVGKPGSPERVAALIAQYATLAESETSPFEEGE